MEAFLASLSKGLSAAYLLVVLLAPGCSPIRGSNIPEDFHFMLDVRNGEPGTSQNINIQIDAAGDGRYEFYETGGVLHYDPDYFITYESDQVVKAGDFKLSEGELSRLVQSIVENKFFELTDHYEMSLGHSYAFVFVQMDGTEHKVNNIGMDVPEIRGMVQAVQDLLPTGIDIEYGEGFIP